MKLFSLLGLILLSLGSSAQNACPCCTDTHRQFDFWIGKWAVYDTAGQWIGDNTIDLIQDSCLLRENWTSANSSGTSYNYYNQSDSSWNQIWVDNQGGQLILTGSLEDSSMVLHTPAHLMNAGVFHEVRWTPQADGSVIQHWILHKGPEIQQTLFYGIYKRK